MSCLRCGSTKLTIVSAAMDDCGTRNVDTHEEYSSATHCNPRLKKIQLFGDHLSFTFCSDCGTIQELYSSTWRGSEKQDGRSPVGFETSGDA